MVDWLINENIIADLNLCVNLTAVENVDLIRFVLCAFVCFFILFIYTHTYYV